MIHELTRIQLRRREREKAIMKSMHAGPFQISFTAQGVELSVREPSEQLLMSYTDCYELFAALYEHRAELYRLAYQDQEGSEDATTYRLNDITYTIDASTDAITIAGWEP